MKKRLMCLALCAIMLMSSLLFVGCSSETEEKGPEVDHKTTETLNLYTITEDKTSPEAVKAVEEAINKITKSRFKTKINLYMFTADEYYAALEQKFEARAAEEEAAKKANSELRAFIKANKGILKEAEAKKKFYEENPQYQKYAETTTDPLAETTVEETIYNEQTGLLELKYPTADPNVIDIFFLDGYDKLLQYIENEWVARLDDELTSSSKVLNDYIGSNLLKSVKIEGATYAIPNNRTIGQYTYMLVNKELLAKYYYNIKDIYDLTDCEDFLADIARFEPGVIPIDGSPAVYNVLYWSINPDTLALDTNKFSVIGTTYSPTTSFGTQLMFTSLFASKKAFRDQILSNKLYEELGYFKSNVSADAKCAVKIVRGGAELQDVYGDKYEMVVLESPRAYQDFIFGSMYAVNGYNDNSKIKRSMEIITYINTNEQMRNLLLYGVENLHYTLDENGQVVRTENNNYWMDINKTGNAFITYTEKGTNPKIWEYGMKQNRDATIDLLLGFTYVGQKVDTGAIRRIQTLSDNILARMDACKTYAELSALVETLTNELSSRSNNDVKNYISTQTEPNAAGEAAPYVLLYDWLNQMGFVSNE